MNITLLSEIAKSISYIIFGGGVQRKSDEDNTDESNFNDVMAAEASNEHVWEEADSIVSSNKKNSKVISAEIINENLTFKNLKGMDEQIKYLRQNILIPLANKDVLLQCGLEPIRRFVFYNSEGSDHALLAKTLTTELSRVVGKKYNFFQRFKKDVFEQYSDESEQYIKSLFEEAIANKPSVVFLEDIHTLYNYCSVLGSSKETVMALSKEMSRDKTDELIVIAGTDQLEKIDPSLLRAGCFEKALRFDSANQERRKSILETHSSKWKLRPSAEILEEMAKKTRDFSFDDLERLCKQSLLLAIQRILATIDNDRCQHCKSCDNSMKLDEQLLENVEVFPEDWNSVYTDIQKQYQNANDEPRYAPDGVETEKTFLTEAIIDKNMGFSSIGGLKEQIKDITEHIIFPLANKAALIDWGVEPVKGIIFHGPPGTGKTLLAKVLAAELSRLKDQPFTFFYLTSTDCLHKYQGETERNLREIFAKAAAKKPSIIFFDEIDGLCPTRTEGERAQFNNAIVTAMLGLLDNVKKGEICVIAATNRIDSVDPALRRPGRFDKAIAFFPPKEEERQEILKIHTSHWKREPSKEILEEISKQTVEYTAADLEQLCRQTFLSAVKRKFPNWNQEDSKMEANGLEDLKILLEDWYTSKRIVKGSDSSVFGNSISSRKSIAPAVSKLLSGIIQEIMPKVLPFLNTQNKTVRDKETGINSFVIWDNGNQQTRIIDNFLIPCLLNSPEFKDTESFTLSYDIIIEPHNLTNLISQLLKCDKTAVLLIPGIEKVGTQLPGSNSAVGENIYSFVNLFLEKMESLRGENVFLLASAGCPISDLPEDFRFLFNGMPNSRTYKLRQLDNAERRKFFSPIFQEHDSLLQDKLDSLTSTSNLYDLLDLNSEFSRACVPGIEKTDLAVILNAILDQFKVNKLDYFRNLDYMYS